MFKDDDGGWRWRLIQRNTLIIVESPESFARRTDAKTAAEAARAAIGAAAVDIV
ncbi:MAG TPA: DUF1508 domain-containing protein [Gaiellaceae bacterium]|nr:DUF1508 domain-containing protein [Gaiellaceae bacterium]